MDEIFHEYELTLKLKFKASNDELAADFGQHLAETLVKQFTALNPVYSVMTKPVVAKKPLRLPGEQP